MKGIQNLRPYCSLSRMRHAIALASILLLISGCGQQDWKKTTNEVLGKVIINGQPAKDVIVKFYSQGDPIDRRESIPWGITNSDGVFKMSTYNQYDGVPAGKFRVGLRWPEDRSRPSPDKLGEKYSDPTVSMFEVEISRGSNNLAPFEITAIKAGK